MSPSEPVPQRIGFEERDAAVEALQEHHSLGRLDTLEFEERMTKALEARTAADVAVLFRDLPEPKLAFLRSPGTPSTAVQLPSTVHSGAAVQDLGPEPTPWFAQWWMILVAVGITVASRGNVGFIIPMMAIWLWVIYPSIAANRRKQRGVTTGTYAQAAAQLPEWQRKRILDEVEAGRKIAAIKLYREYTGAGLADAKHIVEHMARQIEG